MAVAALPPREVLRAMEVGGYHVGTAVLTRFRLDGGSMFGSVPKTLWERHHPADAKNRIALVARVLLLRGHGRVVMVDAGVGDKFAPREQEMFAVELSAAGDRAVPWRDLTDIVLTHLHFDHAGGATVWAPASPDAAQPRTSCLRATSARIHLQRANWERARAPGPRERASYLPENVLPLESGELRLADGPAEILPEVFAWPSHGHTVGMQWIQVGSGKGSIAFPADLVPTLAHLHLPFVMGYDMCVETLLKEKQELLQKAAAEEWRLVLSHDPGTPAISVARDGSGRFCQKERIEIEEA